MKSPSQRILEAHLLEAPYKIGWATGKWSIAEDIEVTWPFVIISVGAAVRNNAPSAFQLRLELSNYPTVGPTGGFWNNTTGEKLAASNWPKGTGQVAAVFRPGWNGSVEMLYHPLDGGSLSTHPNWHNEYPSEVWKEDKSIVDYIDMVWRLLNSKEYNGV